jgi:hypothetical protein
VSHLVRTMWQRTGYNRHSATSYRSATAASAPASVLHTRAELRPVAAEDNGDASEAPGRSHLEYSSDVIKVVETWPDAGRRNPCRTAPALWPRRRLPRLCGW